MVEADGRASRGQASSRRRPTEPDAGPDAASDGEPKPLSRTQLRLKWVRGLKPYRVLIHYLAADANLLAAGMSFQAIFAVFAAVFVGFSVAGVWITSDAELTEALITLINRFVPGLIGENGVIEPDLIGQSGGFFGWAGLISLIGLLWTLIAWLYYTRQAVRAIFGLQRDPRNYVLQKVLDLALAVCLGLLFVVGAAFSIVSTAALTWVLDLLGIGIDSFWGSIGTRIVALALSVLINFVTLGGMFRVLSNIPIPWRDLFWGAGLGSVALALLSVGSSAVIAGASRNPLFATFAVFVGLLLWFNLVSRVILFSAAWIAVGLIDREVRLVSPTDEELRAELEHAQRLVALEELRRAEAEYADARGFGRLRARRRLDQAKRGTDS